MMRFYSKIFFILLIFATICVHTASATIIFYGDHFKVVQCYPNPAGASINFEVTKPTDKALTICIYNFVGKRVAEIKINTPKINVQLNNYFRGLYFFQLKDAQGKVLDSGKFQIIK